MPNISIGGGEVLRLSFGCSANAISSHLCNLEGLACTTAAEDCSLCDPYITHSCSGGAFAPRCLFVDTAEEQMVVTRDAGDEATAAWSGKVETIHQVPSAPSNDPFETFHQVAQSVAEHQFSLLSSAYSKQSKNITPSSSRHVEWNEDEDEGDSSDDDDNDGNRKLMQQKQQQMLVSQQQDAMTRAWEDAVATLTSAEHTHHNNIIQWRDYLLPPFPARSKMISLPFTSTQFLSDTTQANKNSNGLSLDSFVTGYYTNNHSIVSNSWREDVLSEEIRKSLEQCDLLRGTQVLVTDHGFYAGLATSVLEDLTQECKSAARLTVLVTPPSETERKTPRQIFRRNLNSGLAFHSLSENSDLLLPLAFASSDMFSSSALLATAIETATLSYRLLPNNYNNSDATIAIAGATGLGSSSNGDSFFSTYSSMNFREYLSCLRGPTTRHTILEMTASTEPTATNWRDLLLQGTTVAFDPRIKPSNHTKEIPPAGGWLSKNLNSLSMVHGSPSVEQQQHHNQYAMHVSIRRSRVDPSNFVTPFQMQKFQHPLLQSVMEGIATHTEPIGSFSSCIIPQSLSELTSGGYGYWKHTSCIRNTPDFFISTIGNSSRIHPLIEERYNGIKCAISRFHRSGGSGNRGFYTSDIEAGLAPEYEDCDEAVENLKNLDAVYCPPGCNLQSNEMESF